MSSTSQIFLAGLSPLEQEQTVVQMVNAELNGGTNNAR